MTLYIILIIAWYVLFVIGAWKMFEKAGEAGWKSIIPFYNMYIAFKFSWQTTYFWVWLVLSLISGFLSYSLYFNGTAYNNILYSVLQLVTLFITVTLAYHISLSFGHGFWYALGLTFFSFIFTMIIGYGSSRYVGNSTNQMRMA